MKTYGGTSNEYLQHVCIAKSEYQYILVKKKCFTIITLSIGTDMPEQTVKTEQMLQNVASDQGLECLPFIQQYLKHISG